jgi:hypothetical protein
MRRGNLQDASDAEEEPAMEQELKRSSRLGALEGLAKTCIKHRVLTSEEDLRISAFEIMARKSANREFGYFTWHENQRLAAIAKKEVKKLDLGVSGLNLSLGLGKRNTAKEAFFNDPAMGGGRFRRLGSQRSGSFLDPEALETDKKATETLEDPDSLPSRGPEKASSRRKLMTLHGDAAAARPMLSSRGMSQGSSSRGSTARSSKSFPDPSARAPKRSMTTTKRIMFP